MEKPDVGYLVNITSEYTEIKFPECTTMENPVM
jgi:hypothetical protein